MDTPQSVDYVSKLWPVVAGALGGLAGWLLGYDRMRRDVVELKKAVEGGHDDWALPEMRRQLKAAFTEIDRLKEKTRSLELADASSLSELRGYVNAQKDRIDTHAKRSEDQQTKNAEYFAHEARAALAKAEEVEARIAKAAGSNA